MKEFSVVIVDDHTLLSQAIQTMVNTFDRFKVQPEKGGGGGQPPVSNQYRFILEKEKKMQNVLKRKNMQTFLQVYPLKTFPIVS